MVENLKDFYDQLYNNAIDKLISDQYEIDSMIDLSVDKRFGLTLIIKLDAHVTERIQQFLTTLRSIEPDQYYYPSSDMHVTFLPIIPCHENFDINHIVIQDYIDLIRTHLSTAEPFKIRFEGITASSSCIMIQGFFNDNILNERRDQLRKAFTVSSLHQNIDQRYILRTAHATVIRFKKPFIAKEKFLETIASYRHCNFGTTVVKKIELVLNDWYLKEKSVQTLFCFELK